MLFFAVIVGMFPQNLPKKNKEKVPEELALMTKNPIYVETCRPISRDEENNSLFNEYKKQEIMLEPVEEIKLERLKVQPDSKLILLQWSW